MTARERKKEKRIIFWAVNIFGKCIDYNITGQKTGYGCQMDLFVVNYESVLFIFLQPSFSFGTLICCF